MSRAYKQTPKKRKHDGEEIEKAKKKKKSTPQVGILT